MRVHYFQHVNFEGLGCIASWIAAEGATMTVTRFYENTSLPRVEEIDFLIIMGGPMSANDEAAFPWLVAEKECIRSAIQRKKAVLGICLGAQLIASALGSSVFPNSHKEIGWFPIESVLGPNQQDFRFPDQCTVFHWHGETFDLPPGSVPLAKSAACENQAFQIGRHVIGLQFHLETTPESVRAMLAHGKNELVEAPYIQAESQIREVPPSAFQQINDLMGDILSYLTSPLDLIDSSKGS
jgi:GMP synthase-like glutamine amidotransferase